jgi:tetratricopeptide (TPR) repeat protein
MTVMKLKNLGMIVLIIASLLIGATPLYPIPKEIEKALKLNRINHFDEALEEVNRALKEERIKPDITSAYTIGRILYRKGELYREMAKLNVLTHIGYMLQLNEGEKNPADETLLFLGIGYFFNNQYQDAIDVLRKVVNNRRVDSELFHLSLVYLGASYYQMGDRKKAEALWERVGRSNILAYSTLGYIYSYFMIDVTKGEEMTRSLLREAESASILYADTIKMNHAYTLLALGRFDDAYDFAKDIDLNNPVYIYNPDQKTEIRFYDFAILDSYSKIMFGESIKNLEPIVTSSSGELASFACYYVAQMYLHLKDYERALKFTLKAKKLAVISSLTMIRAVACEASIDFLTDKDKQGARLLEDEITRIHGKPSSLLEMINVVIASSVDYAKVKDLVSKVEGYLYDTQWERTRRDTALLGELAFFTGRYVRALYYLERARDKGNKNKIETNDPTFLLKLSYVYYSREYYPESLEILFSLAKSFSGIRPLQDAVQSVYSYKQKGSGEAIID